MTIRLPAAQNHLAAKSCCPGSLGNYSTVTMRDINTRRQHRLIKRKQPINQRRALLASITEVGHRWSFNCGDSPPSENSIEAAANSGNHAGDDQHLSVRRCRGWSSGLRSAVRADRPVGSVATGSLSTSPGSYRRRRPSDNIASVPAAPYISRNGRTTSSGAETASSQRAVKATEMPATACCSNKVSNDQPLQLQFTGRNCARVAVPKHYLTEEPQRHHSPGQIVHPTACPTARTWTARSLRPTSVAERRVALQ